MTALADLQVPGPTVTKLTEPFWNAVREGQLLIQRCGVCELAVFYPRGRCPHCWSDSLDWEIASGKGALKSFSNVWKPGHSGWIPAAPYVVGLVKLKEGPTMLSHIVNDVESFAVGDPLGFVPVNIGGRILPCFKFYRE